MIKKLMLITGILLSTSLWADMDKVCKIDIENDGFFTNEYMRRVEYYCERNNILLVLGLIEEMADWMRVEYCRYDRNVDIKPHGTKFKITCVLYDNEPREYIETKFRN
jgi:hypothetical protein